MKKTLLLIAISAFATSSFCQRAIGIKALDPAMMENKILYIPDYNEADAKILRRGRKGKDQKIGTAKAYAQLWDRVMAASSWDATPYEIKKFDKRKMIKERNPKALLLSFLTIRSECKSGGSTTNRYAQILMTGPKKRKICHILINGLSWYDDDDLRLIVNMLSHSLNLAIEAYEEESGSKRAKVKSKYKEETVKFVDDIKSKTFLVQRRAVTDEKHKENIGEDGLKPGKIKRMTKRHERNKSKDKEVEAAMKSAWKMCDYKMMFKHEISDIRKNLEENYFFWVNIWIDTCSPLVIGANTNYLFSTNGDKVLASFAGKGKMKPATVENIQKKLLARYERFKRQLAK